MKRVVAASNAGFQALHGEFGMMADGVVYLPPKPYAATVTVLRDGTTGFGTWPEDTGIPESVLSDRQHDGAWCVTRSSNPYNRTWWGGTPPGWADKTDTVRTGICMTGKERFVAYFYGADLSPDALAQAMIQARCGLRPGARHERRPLRPEFHKVGSADELEPVKGLQYDWQHEGEVLGLHGWKFRARRFIRGMGRDELPPVHRGEPRLLLHDPAPRAPRPGAHPGGAGRPWPRGEWRLKGLPQHGFPYALALAEIGPTRPGPISKLRVLQMDPRMLSAVSADKKAAKTVAVLDAGDKPAAESQSLWHSAGASPSARSRPSPRPCGSPPAGRPPAAGAPARSGSGA